MRRRSTRQQQRGAVAVFAAIAVGAGLVALGLAIDIGRLYSAQRELQRIANIAALDAARAAGGCLGVPDSPQATAYGEALSSIQRNGGRDPAIKAERVELGRDLLAADGRHYFDPSPGQTNHAVRVTLTRAAPARLLPLSRATGPLTAAAAAHSRPHASLHVGSRLAEFDPDGLDRFFGALLGDNNLAISAVGYTSLLEATVPLDSVLEALVPGAADSLRLRDQSLAGLLRAVAEELADAGNSAAATAALQLAAAADAGATVLPEEIIALERESAALVGSALIGVGPLTLLAAQTSSDTPAVDLLYTLPEPLGDSTAQIRFIDPGRPAIATPVPAETDPEPENYASNAQALLQTVVGFEALPGARLRLPLWVQAAQGTAQVTDIRCARHGQPHDTVTVLARSSVSRIGIGEFDDINAPQPRPREATLFDGELPPGTLGIPTALRLRITGFGALDVPSAQDELVFHGPFPAPPQSIGGPDALAILDAMSQLPQRMQLRVQLEPVAAARALTALDGALQRAIETARASLEDALRRRIAEVLVVAGDELLARALRDAGLTLGGADVRVYDVVAREPYLFTR